jgi:hypothetical protein
LRYDNNQPIDRMMRDLDGVNRGRFEGREEAFDKEAIG